MAASDIPAPTQPMEPTDHLETVDYWRDNYLTAIQVGQETLTKLKTALRDVSQDMHQTSTRPCGTCAAVTKALGESFGCVAYQREQSKRHHR